MSSSVHAETPASARTTSAPGPSSLLQRKCACGGSAGLAGECTECRKKKLTGGALQTKLTINEPGDVYEQEADRVADAVMRMGDSEVSLQAKSAQGGLARKTGLGISRYSQGGGGGEAPPIVHDVLNSPGQPLDASTRALMEPRFEQNFSGVRIHADARAAKSARAVNALAYTVGNDVVFGEGLYIPNAISGQKLLAHELTHVVQQGATHPRGRNLMRQDSQSIIQEQSEEKIDQGPKVRLVITDKKNGYVKVYIDHLFIYEVRLHDMQGGINFESQWDSIARSFTLKLIVAQDAEVQISPDAVHLNDFFSSVVLEVVRISPLSKMPLLSPVDGSKRTISIVPVKPDLNPISGPANAVAPHVSMPESIHDEGIDSGQTPVPNREAWLNLPDTTTASTPPICSLPKELGSGLASNRRCGVGPDFGHFDGPPKSLKSKIKLAAWAAGYGRISRHHVTNAECELEMDAVLTLLAGAPGHDAFARFAAGTGGIETHDKSKPLGALALASSEFAATLAIVKNRIEAQLALQASKGTLNLCALAVTPPPTFFASRHFYYPGALKSVIGGTHGEQLLATAFTGNIPMRSYTIDLRFLICDNFGAGEDDLYAPGLFGFWVLQHERSPKRYAPFINLLDLPVRISGTF